MENLDFNISAELWESEIGQTHGQKTAEGSLGSMVKRVISDESRGRLRYSILTYDGRLLSDNEIERLAKMEAFKVWTPDIS